MSSAFSGQKVSARMCVCLTAIQKCAEKNKWGQNKRKQIQQKKEARATAKEQHAKKKTKNVKIALNHLQTLWAKIGCFLFFSEKKKMLTSLQLTKTELRVWKWEYGMVTEGQAGVKGNAVFAKRASFLILQKCYVAFNTLRHCNT